jgi:hypothetical protein
MKPSDTLKTMKLYKLNIEKAKKMSVAVGLPIEKASGKVYGNGMTVMEVGYVHEYGIGVPMRSWLREPLELNQKKLNDFTQVQFKKVIEQGMDAKKALAQVGLKAEGFISDAFETGGYGKWEGLSDETIAQKGSTTILIDKGTLSQSVASAVRE